MPRWIPILAVAAGWAGVHALAGRLRHLSHIPRSQWLSLAGGISVAYVFVHLVPELARGAEHTRSEELVFLVALAGLGAFYGLERAVCRSKGAGKTAPAGVFWLHIGSFAVYNALAAYLLVRSGQQGGGELGLYGLAIGVHFLVNDVGLLAHHGDRYHSRGRWLLVSAVGLGLALGWLVPVPREASALIFALLAGGVVLNVLKEELPEERESRFWAFAAGAAAYAALLVQVG